jgi:peptidoglycan pentaglycine glycine transferase (the first glycine)
VAELRPDADVGDAEWDAWVAATPGGHHLQTSGWARVKAGAGWRVERVAVRDGAGIVAGCQLLVRALPVYGAIAYAPRAPLVAGRDPVALDVLLAALRERARARRILFAKLQPPIDREDLPAQLLARGLIASSLHTAPVASVRIDLQGRDDDALLADMRQTTRRRIRQATRADVQVRAGDDRDLEVLQRLLDATARRQGFAPYPEAYYREVWGAFAPDRAQLLVAEHEGRPLSAALLIAFGDTVLYKIGAWGGAEDAPPGVNELMHWTAIRRARDAGHRFYDFEGIPEDVARAARAGERPPADGVAFFKLGFGGEAVLYPGTYDLAFGRVSGPVLRRLLPHTPRLRGLAHRVAGRQDAA